MSELEYRVLKEIRIPCGEDNQPESYEFEFEEETISSDISGGDDPSVGAVVEDPVSNREGQMDEFPPEMAERLFYPGSVQVIQQSLNEYYERLSEGEFEEGDSSFQLKEVRMDILDLHRNDELPEETHILFHFENHQNIGAILDWDKEENALDVGQFLTEDGEEIENYDPYPELVQIMMRRFSP